jgi:hypothetical protein
MRSIHLHFYLSHKAQTPHDLPVWETMELFKCVWRDGRDSISLFRKFKVHDSPKLLESNNTICYYLPARYLPRVVPPRAVFIYPLHSTSSQSFLCNPLVSSRLELLYVSKAGPGWPLRQFQRPSQHKDHLSLFGAT